MCIYGSEYLIVEQKNHVFGNKPNTFGEFATCKQTNAAMGGAKGSGTRKLLSTKRLRGTVLDWFDKFGWIQATQEIDHPDAYRNQGRIYLLAEDVQEDLPGIGCAVTFFLYQDANGLGAMNVRPAAQIPGQQVAQGGKTFSGGKGGKAQPQSFAQQLPNPKRMKTVQYSGGYAPVQTGPVMPHEEVLQKVHSCLNKQVWKAIKKIAEKEKDWDEMELFKRITKYLYKGAQAPELLTMPWQQSAQQYIETAMRGYSTACADKPWFFDMDLTVAFHMSYWEILSGSGQNPQWSEVEAVLNAKYEELMDDCLLDKAIWDSAGLLLPDQEALRNKVYKGLKSAHERAREETLASPLRDDLQRVEFFTKSWIHNSMGKAWQAIEQGGLMNPESVVMLFQELLAPFGEEHPFSCVPGVLSQSIGRPPRDWEFLQEAVGEFFLNWNSAGTEPTYGGASKRRSGYKRHFQAPSGPGGGAVSIMPANVGAGGAEPEMADAAELGGCGVTDGTDGLEEEEDPVSKALMEQVAAAEMTAGEASAM